MIAAHGDGAKEAMVLLAEFLHLVPWLEGINIVDAADPRNALSNVSTFGDRENAVCHSPHGPGRAFVPGGRRLEKKTYLTKSRTKVASAIYAAWRKDSSREDDGIDNIVQNGDGLGREMESRVCRGYALEG